VRLATLDLRRRLDATSTTHPNDVQLLSTVAAVAPFGWVALALVAQHARATAVGAQCPTSGTCSRKPCRST